MTIRRFENRLQDIQQELEELLQLEQLEPLLARGQKVCGEAATFFHELEAKELKLTIFDGDTERPFGLPEEEKQNDG